MVFVEESSASASASSTPPEEKKGSNNDDKDKDEQLFECNICLETAVEPVVSMCGHLFCWVCLHRWLETRPNRHACPVCKAAISRDKVIPLYGRGSNKRNYPKNETPPRPPGHRSEPQNNRNLPSFEFGGRDLNFSFGIGTFQLGFFGFFQNGHIALGNPFEDEQFISKVFFWLAIWFIGWLLIA